jgi:RimJ/RimL family protein N-acetyltransferase
VIATTSRLRLREWTLDDLRDFVAIHAGEARPAELIERDLRATLRRYRLHGMGMWCVARTRDGRIVGQCGLQRMEGTLEVELGFLLAPDFRGSGYATEAARAAVAHGFDELGLERIVAVTRPGNRRSIAVLESLGMVLEKQVGAKEREGLLYSLGRPSTSGADTMGRSRIAKQRG